MQRKKSLEITRAVLRNKMYLLRCMEEKSQTHLEFQRSSNYTQARICQRILESYLKKKIYNTQKLFQHFQKIKSGKEKLQQRFLGMMSTRFPV